MAIMNDTLKDIAGRTKTFSKCGALMSEATRRLALSCRLRRPYVASEDTKEMEVQEQQREMEVAQRRRAVGEDMASLLAVMSEVSKILLLGPLILAPFHVIQTNYVLLCF